MPAEIRLFPCLTDNFGYLIHDPATKATASIDAPEAAPVIEALEREGWTLTDILITHHHGDHVGGVAELKQKYRCRVLAPHDKSAKIANVDARVAHGDVVKVGGLLARVLETPVIPWITSATCSTARKRCLPPTRCSRSAAGGCSRGPTRRCGNRCSNCGRCPTISNSIAATNTLPPTSNSR